MKSFVPVGSANMYVCMHVCVMNPLTSYIKIIHVPVFSKLETFLMWSGLIETAHKVYKALCQAGQTVDLQRHFESLGAPLKRVLCVGPEGGE